MGKTKHLGIPIEPELYRKLMSLAQFNGNSVNKEVIRKYIFLQKKAPDHSGALFLSILFCSCLPPHA